MVMWLPEVVLSPNIYLLDVLCLIETLHESLLTPALPSVFVPVI